MTVKTPRYTVWDDVLGYVYLYGLLILLLVLMAAVSVFPPIRLSWRWLAGTAIHTAFILILFCSCVLLFRAWTNNRQKAAELKPYKPLKNSPLGTRAGWLTVIFWTIGALCLWTTGLQGPAPGFLRPYTMDIFGTFIFCFLAGCAMCMIWQEASASFVPPQDDREPFDQKPHGNAAYATADDLRRGGFIE